MSSKKHHRKATGLNLIAPDHYRHFETVITRNATEYSVRSFEDGVEIFYIDLTKHPVADWSKVTETLCLMHHIAGPVRKPHVNGRKHRRPEAEKTARYTAVDLSAPGQDTTRMAIVRVEGGKKVYDLTDSGHSLKDCYVVDFEGEEAAR